MSTDTGSPTATNIKLTYDDDAEHWIARDEETGVTTRAPTRQAALEALDEAVADRTEGDTTEWEIDPDDPFFSAPAFSSGTSDVSENVDEYLAEGIYRDKVAPDDES